MTGKARADSDQIDPVDGQLPPLSQIPCYSLLPSKNSLLGLKKFPVPLRREFRCKTRESQGYFGRKSRKRAAICKIPCKIPCCREFAGNLTAKDQRARGADSIRPEIALGTY